MEDNPRGYTTKATLQWENPLLSSSSAVTPAVVMRPIHIVSSLRAVAEERGSEMPSEAVLQEPPWCDQQTLEKYAEYYERAELLGIDNMFAQEPEEDDNSLERLAIVPSAPVESPAAIVLYHPAEVVLASDEAPRGRYSRSSPTVPFIPQQAYNPALHPHMTREEFEAIERKYTRFEYTSPLASNPLFGFTGQVQDIAQPARAFQTDNPRKSDVEIIVSTYASGHAEKNALLPIFGPAPEEALSDSAVSRAASRISNFFSRLFRR